MPGEDPVPAGDGPIAEGFYYFLMAAAFMLLGAFLPPLLLLAPAPLAALVYRQGYRTGMLAGLSLAFGIFWLQGGAFAVAPGEVASAVRFLQLTMLAGLLIVGLAGLSIGGAWREGASSTTALLAGAGAFSLPPIGAYTAAALGWGVDLLQQGHNAWRVLIVQEIARQRAAGTMPAETLDQMSQWLDAAEPAFAAMRTVALGTLLITAFAGSLGSVGLAHRLLRRRTPFPEGLPPFQLWRLPWYVVVGFIVGQGIVLLNTLGFNLGALGTLGLNLHLFFSGVYLVQGVAVVYYFLTRRPIAAVLRFAVVAAAVWWLSFFVMWLGVLDTWFNFRRLSGDGGGETKV